MSLLVKKTSLRRSSLAQTSAVPPSTAHQVATLPYIDAPMKEKSSQVAGDISDAVVQLLNESSIGLYRIQEHVLKKSPQISAERRELVSLTESIDSANMNLEEVQQIVSEMNREQAFERCLERINKLQQKLSS